MKWSTKKGSLSRAERKLLHRIGFLIATKPKDVERLLRKLRIKLSKAPDADELADAVIRALAKQHQPFNAELEVLLRQTFGNSSDQDNFIGAIAGGLSALSSSVAGIFSSKKERDVAKANAQANRDVAQANLKATMAQGTFGLLRQRAENQMAALKSAARSSTTKAIAGVAVLLIVGFFGFRMYRSRQLAAAA
ncbi:MAG: hypothetical protein AAGB22_04995 [Bacteroidota bacterium]